MDRAVKEWLSNSRISNVDSSSLTKKLNKSYTIYGAMLLFPPTAFVGPEWTALQPNIDHNDMTALYTSICKHLKVTHVAMNKPIPLHLSATTSLEESEEKFNILRSPSSFTPIHGDFGPSTASDPPTQSDFAAAYWVTAKQNGIYQTWAPRWTMFSRGNISEKARLLTLPSVLQAVEERPSSAVDLYAGIGYFAFSYVKAGVDKVFCWDLNAWSCEGLRRGAAENRWGVVDGDDEDAERFAEARLIVFNESNAKAAEKMKMLKSRVPPVRHVNCGMLPSSRGGLEIAAKVLDSRFVGWVHVHENFLVEDIDRRAEETRAEMQAIFGRLRTEAVRVQVEHVNRLKNYAPGVMHCVVDLVVYATLPP